jgi:four helix bundle protein
MNYQEWVKSVPETIAKDLLWKMEVYRLGLFIADIGWVDIGKLHKDRRTWDMASQLYRALGSIGANISEGYSRSSGRDRARFYEYALGSARESRTWYYEGRHLLGEKVTEHRLVFLSQIIRLLLTILPKDRLLTLHDDSPPYGNVNLPPSEDTDCQLIQYLNQDVPF